MDGAANNSAVPTRQNLATFRALYLILQIIGGVMIVLMACWILGYRNGLSWSLTPSVQFNWHPLLMTIGMVFLYGNCKLIDEHGRGKRIKYFFVGSNFGISWLPVYEQKELETLSCINFRYHNGSCFDGIISCL